MANIKHLLKQLFKLFHFMPLVKEMDICYEIITYMKKCTSKSQIKALWVLEMTENEAMVNGKSADSTHKMKDYDSMW